MTDLPSSKATYLINKVGTRGQATMCVVPYVILGMYVPKYQGLRTCMEGYEVPRYI